MRNPLPQVAVQGLHSDHGDVVQFVFSCKEQCEIGLHVDYAYENVRLLVGNDGNIYTIGRPIHFLLFPG